MLRKRTMMRLAFVIEVIIFGWFYQYGVGGMGEIGKLQQDNETMERHIGTMQHDIVVRTTELEGWMRDPFHKEKLAREQIHMAREGEEIYLLQ